MRPPVKFPEMRDQVIASVQSLADPSHQKLRWGRYDECVNYFDNLTLNVHVLYDDCQVLPEPSRSIGAVLYEDEVQALRDLHAALGPMLDDLQDSSGSDYLADPRWSEVVEAAGAALDVMRSSE
jgi:hypothetical protein